MSRRRPSSREPRTQFSLRRLILLVLVAVAAVFALRDAAAQVVVRGDSGAAHSLAPWDGVITARFALDTMRSGGAAGANRNPSALAQQALRQDATAVDAFNVLAGQAQLRGETGRTGQLFEHSLTLSRRELMSRIWAIENAATRGDIRSALANYDFALKTSKDAPGILYPVLANALDEPLIRSHLLEIMKTRPNWAPAFTDYLSRAAVNPQGTAAFYPMLAQAGLPVSPLQHARVVDALSVRGYDTQAWEYYALLHPGADRRRSRDIRQAGPADAQTVFDWQPLNTGGLSASLVRNQSGAGELGFAIAAASSGDVAQQRQVLPPGRYLLRGEARGIAAPEQERPYFSVLCADGRELVRSVLPGAGERTFSNSFTVGGDCPVQTLVLVARPTDNAAGIEGSVTTVTITPSR